MHQPVREEGLLGPESGDSVCQCAKQKEFSMFPWYKRNL